MLNLAGEIKNSLTNGPGLRYVIFTQGCSHSPHCKGCHNIHTWSNEPNLLISIDDMFKNIEKELPLIKGVTFSGGEPFDQAKELFELAIKCKSLHLNVLCYTGYTYEELQQISLLRSMEATYIRRLLESVDILIDGKFEIDNQENHGLYRGSKNQRMIYLDKGKIIKIE
jgi:anaerobic ribonucleoside-triphosphate reductase activating protein